MDGGINMKGYSLREKILIIALAIVVTTALCGGSYITYKAFNPQPITYTGGF